MNKYVCNSGVHKYGNIKVLHQQRHQQMKIK